MTQEQPVYSAFAEIYDQVMRDVDYDGWSQHILNLCQKFSIPVKKILELACGTGSLALRLAAAGYQVVGVDQADDMLEQARAKFEENGAAIPLLQGSMESLSPLNLERDFDLILCLYDSLNYLLEVDTVRQCFAEAGRHLRPGGAFIFDVTTEYNLIHNFAGFTFAENLDNASYIWENEYNIVKKICSSKVTIFRRADGQYEKQVETHVQRVYPTAQIQEWLKEEGFTILGLYHNLTEKPPQDKCERIHFVCQKPA